MIKMTQINGQFYEQRKGVVLGKDFLDKQTFEQAFRQMLRNSQGYQDFRMNLAQAEKIIHIVESTKGKRQNVLEYTTNLEQISEAFSHFMFGLGGDISLLTTFNFDSKTNEQESYFLAHEQDLPSSLDASGQRLYHNTLESLWEAKREGKKIQQMNEHFTKHLNDFYKQLINPKIWNDNKQDYQTLQKWAYHNMKSRYDAINALKNKRRVSLSRYFWGKGYTTQGNAAEAFGHHIALMHPNILMGEHIINLRKSVIEEHGGPGNIGLYNLLLSAKGNTASQLSGDIVVVQDGKVKFNIQSKSSKNISYEFLIKYTGFLNKMQTFLHFYEKYCNIDNPAIEQKDIDILFNQFSTTAWVPIGQKAGEKISELIHKEIENTILLKQK